MGWHWHQLNHMQIICTSLQTDKFKDKMKLTLASALHSGKKTAKAHFK